MQTVNKTTFGVLEGGLDPEITTKVEVGTASRNLGNIKKGDLCAGITFFKGETIVNVEVSSLVGWKVLKNDDNILDNP
jgi:hypothetical protein